MGDTESIRVVVIHPSPFLRRGVRLALEDEPDLAVVGEFGRAEPAVAEVSQLDPRVVVLSVSMSDMSGFAAYIQILEVAPDARIIMLTSQGHPRRADRHDTGWRCWLPADGRPRARPDPHRSLQRQR